MDQSYLKQLDGNIRSGNLPEAIMLTILRLPKQVLYLVGGFGLLVLISSLIVLPEETVYGLTAVGFGIPLFILVWHRPDIGVVGIMLLTSGLIPSELAEIRLPFGGLELSDIVFLSMLGLVAFQGLLRKSLTIPWPAVGVPLIIFLLIALLSLINALIFENVEPNWALNDMRILIYYGMFFLTAWSIKEPKHLTSILFGLFIITDLIAIAIIAQQFLGESTFLFSGMASGRGNIVDQGGIVRVVPAAHALLHFMAVTATALIIFTKKSNLIRGFYILQLIVLGISSLLTLTRSQWLATGIAIIFMSVVLAPRFRKQLVRGFLIVGIPTTLMLISFLGFFGTNLQSQLGAIDLIDNIIERAATLTDPGDTLASNSLVWRQFEFEQATQAIAERPFLGVALGNSYREVTTLQGEAQGWWTDRSLAAGEISRFTRYVHNSYLAIAVKMGLTGLISFLLICLSFIVNCWRLYRRLPFGILQGVTLAILAGFLGLMQWSYLFTHFIRPESTIAVGIMMGIVAAIARMNAQGDPLAASPTKTTQSVYQNIQWPQIEAIFNKGGGLYGLLLVGAILAAGLFAINPFISNARIVSPFAANSTTEIELPADIIANSSQSVASGLETLNVIQPQESRSFEPDETIFISWIWPSKLQPEQLFTVILSNNQQQVVLGTLSELASNNRYWINAIIPADLAAGEYKLLIQLQGAPDEPPAASSQPRIIYILGKPELPTPTIMPTAAPTQIPSPTPVPVPMVQIAVASASLREGPSVRFGIIDYLFADEIVQVLAKDSAEGEWYNVVLADGSTGWVAEFTTIPVNEEVLTAVSIAATLPPLPTPTITPTPLPTFTPTAVAPPPQENNPAPASTNAPPPTPTPPPLP